MIGDTLGCIRYPSTTIGSPAKELSGSPCTAHGVPLHHLPVEATDNVGNKLHFTWSYKLAEVYLLKLGESRCICNHGMDRGSIWELPWEDCMTDFW